MSDSKAPPQSVPPLTTPYREMVQRLRVYPMTLRDIERAAIEAALHSSSMNVAHASRMLGIGRTTFYRKMKTYGVR